MNQGSGTESSRIANLLNTEEVLGAEEFVAQKYVLWGKKAYHEPLGNCKMLNSFKMLMFSTCLTVSNCLTVLSKVTQLTRKGSARDNKSLIGVTEL